jgi:NAD-dependent DNA ligase
MDVERDRAPGANMTKSRRVDRASNELVGICRGLLADGHVSQQEAEFLKGWIERNAEFVGDYPFSAIYNLLAEILRDGVIDDEESADLHDTLIRFVGGEAFEASAQTASLSTALPIDVPAPAISHSGAVFVVTGTFTYGARSRVTEAIQTRGGLVSAAPSRKVNYLVIGELGSRDWINSNAGTKIMKAVELRGAGHPIAIVGESHWASSLG